MHGSHILRDLVVVLAVSLLVVFALRRVRVPTVAALLLAGVLIGPGGLALVPERDSIAVIAEIGVALLLFSIGLKLSLRELFRLKGLILGAGGLQVALTIGVALGVAAPGEGLPRGVFYGYLLAMSSTALVLKLLDDRGETGAPHGRLNLSVLIFQDLAVIPMMLTLPLLAAAASGLGAGGERSQALLALAKSLVAVALIIVAARFGIPWLMERVVRSRSREVFTLATILAALGTAWLGSTVGLSLALGAFLAGIVMADSVYAQQALAEIVPLKEVFGSLFFVSIGMLVEPAWWLARPLEPLALGLAVLLGKALIVGVVALLFGFGPRVAVLSGLGLAQIGEFSFVLAQAGAAAGLLDGDRMQAFLAVSVLTLIVTPFVALLSPRLASQTARVAWLQKQVGIGQTRRGRLATGIGSGAPAVAALGGTEPVGASSDHVLIVGHGVNGRNVARVLRQLGIRYIILELNPLTVRTLQEQGEPAQYGDATSREVLRLAGVAAARVMVIAISDPAASRQIVVVARGANPRLTIVVRTRYIAEVDALYRLGAHEVVPEEFETSLEMAGAALAAYGAPPRIIEREKAAIRQERYRLLSAEGHASRPRVPLHELLAAADFEELELPGESPAAGQTLRALDLRGRTGASVVAVARDGVMIGNPGADFSLRAGDLVYVWGQPGQMDAARALLVVGRGHVP